MKSGNHAHKCMRCKHDKACAQITHCRRPDEFICEDCEAEHTRRNELHLAQMIEMKRTWETK